MFKKLLSRRGLSFDRLSALIELSEAGTLVKAADGDPNRQTLYSRQIKELEDFFGVELTRRRGHRLELTEAGRRLVDISRETFLQLEDFQGACEQQPLTVTVGGGDSVLQWLFLPRFGELHHQFPEVEIQFRDLSTTEVARELCELRVDFGILRESALVPPLKSARLLRMTYSLFVPKTLLPEGSHDYRRLLGCLPLALQSTGGQFHTTFEAAARK